MIILNIKRTKSDQEGGGVLNVQCTCVFFYRFQRGTDKVTSPLPLSPKSILRIFT